MIDIADYDYQFLKEAHIRPCKFKRDKPHNDTRYLDGEPEIGDFKSGWLTLALCSTSATLMAGMAIYFMLTRWL